MACMRDACSPDPAVAPTPDEVAPGFSGVARLRAQVNGALLSLGDCHTSQGDSEFDGTAIETSVTVRLRVTLHKADVMPRVRCLCAIFPVYAALLLGMYAFRACMRLQHSTHVEMGMQLMWLPGLTGLISR